VTGMSVKSYSKLVWTPTSVAKRKCMPLGHKSPLIVRNRGLSPEISMFVVSDADAQKAGKRDWYIKGHR